MKTIIDRFRGWLNRYMRRQSIRYMISLAFTLVAVLSMIGMGVLLYDQFARSMRQAVQRENQQYVNQITINMTNYTHDMMNISDSLTYSVIKQTDIREPQAIKKEIDLLYEANKDNLVSIACFRDTGELVAATPISNVKPDVDVTTQDWFIQASENIENYHFSTPHVQNIFLEDNSRYHWVVSLSVVVDLTVNGQPGRGVLLVDMSYTAISQIFSRLGNDASGYAYMIDSEGEIIYHEKERLIRAGLYHENSEIAASYPDGPQEEVYEGSLRQVIVKTVGYTGWKIVSVIPNSELVISSSQMRLFVITVVFLAAALLVVIIGFISSRIAQPILELENSVRDLEKGSLDLNIYTGGPYEVSHLGLTIRSAVEQMRYLMGEIVREQEEKRKSEFDALQAQINPHFLYNTLDSIVWMIESGRQREAISMVTALASLFRISLSGGKAIIPLRTELQHAQYYLYIQKIRYKNKFSVEVDVDESIQDCMTIKLILQPLLENAIYHAMELMDDEGEITIRGYADGDDIVLEVKDNGLGIPKDMIPLLLTGQAPKSGRKGSGIGVRNVHQRLRLYYGEKYGLTILSKADQGTTVLIRIPAVRETAGISAGGDAQ